MRISTYLVVGMVLLLLLFTIILAPYAMAYIKYFSSKHGIENGARFTYYGRIFFEGTYNETHIINSLSRHYIFKLNISFSDSYAEIWIKVVNNTDIADGFIAGDIFNFSEERVIFIRELQVDRDHPMIKVLFPTSSKEMVSEYSLKIFICESPGKILFGDLSGSPSIFGVPRKYVAGFYLLNDDVLIGEAPLYYSDIKCGFLRDRYDGGTFLSYLKMDNGYILYHFSSDYANDFKEERLSRIIYLNGGPIINMLIDTFNIDFLSFIRDAYRNIANLSIDIYWEKLILYNTNISPRSQEWLLGLITLYIGLTPLSEVITAVAIIMFVLHIRRR